MKWTKRMKRTALIMLIAVVAVIAGCQAVAGVDFNKVIVNSLKVDSAESKSTISLQLLTNKELIDELELPAQQQRLLTLVSNLKLQVNEAKVQDANHMSAKGALTLGDSSSIGYGLVIDGDSAIITLDGAKKPFVLDMTGTTALETLGMEAPADSSAKPASDETLTALGKKLIDQIGGYLVGTMPNPEGLSVVPAQASVNGETLTLAHVNVQLDATQVWAWAKDYLTKLQGDREGLRKLIVGVTDLLMEDPALLKAIVGDDSEEPIAKPTDEEINEIADSIIESIQSLTTVMKDTEKDKDFKKLVNKDSYVKADLYVDSKLDVRKTDVEVKFKPDASIFEDEGIPFEGVVLNVNQEMWNVNGTVVSDKVDAQTKKSAQPIEALAQKQGYEVLRMFDTKSTVYSLLRNDLHIGKQTVSLYVWDESNPPIITPAGVTLVPLREVANQLGASLTASNGKLTFYDPAKKTSIVLRKGNKQVLVNGKNQTWSFPVTAIGGTTYVAARDLAKALGTTIQWIGDSNSKYIFMMEREVS
ncbi:copper amine oxidase N-terminal domain-containing protein [Paenibacillus sp. MMS18-CY102]|uniref:copper amine oxidase N-terminal domain-containing protein n=1 Tax=Paenibacillus sp. MMS18-CY102 TaxID=2682849 RepID=UPI001365EAC4|nr:copper amine oxidase N-terminal domain-containing protein [Paenibacillus sp. MMS18-CY102]MWC29547.1 hypothetical protein [Paenibacillus sp. MMS18-CY102]